MEMDSYFIIEEKKNESIKEKLTLVPRLLRRVVKYISKMHRLIGLSDAIEHS